MKNWLEMQQPRVAWLRSSHQVVQLKILSKGVKQQSTNLGFTRTDFSLFRELAGGHGRQAPKSKGALENWQVYPKIQIPEVWLP